MSDDQTLKDHLLFLLRGGGAHLDFESAFVDLPPELRGAKPEGIPHSPWRLLEHMRICLWDILEYCRNPQHVSPDFPDGYWPETDAPPSEQAWEQSLQAFREDQAAFEALIEDPEGDLLAQIPHAQPGHTLLREALILADHNAYHLGQLIIVRRALGAWSDD